MSWRGRSCRRTADEQGRQLVEARDHRLGAPQIAGAVRPGRDGDAAHAVGVRAGDVVRRVADDDGLRAWVGRAARARPPARDRGKLGAVLGVRAEGALAAREEAAEAGAIELEARDRLEIAADERELDAPPRGER